MKFLRSLESKATQGDPEAPIRFAGSAARVLQTGQAPWLGWSTQRAITDGYQREPAVFRGIHALAVAVSSLPVVLRQDDPWHGKIIDTTEDPMLELLNRKANGMEFGSAFRYRTVTQLMLSERGVAVERIKSKGGKLLALHLLPPDITVPIPPTIEQMAEDPDQLVHHWEVRVPGFPTQIVPADDVCWIRWPHPTDVYTGVTPIRPLALSIDTSYAARLYNRRFLAKDGRPGGIVTVKGGITRDEKQELQRRLSGVDNVGETSVLGADDVNYVDLASRPRDMAYKDLRPAMKEEIYSGVGTPESVAGNASGRTFANADAEKENWYVNEVMPTAGLMFQALSIWTSGEQINEVLGADTSKIPVLQRFARELGQYHLQEGLSGAITRTEYRELTGREALTKEQMDDLFIPNPDAPQPAGGPPGAGGGMAPTPPKPGMVPRVPGGASLGGTGTGMKADMETDEWTDEGSLSGSAAPTRPHGFTRRRVSGLPRSF